MCEYQEERKSGRGGGKRVNGKGGRGKVEGGAGENKKKGKEVFDVWRAGSKERKETVDDENLRVNERSKNDR